MQVSAVDSVKYFALKSYAGAESCGRKLTSPDKYSANDIYDDINEWKEFCHKLILGKNTDFMA